MKASCSHTNTGQEPACSQRPADYTEANIEEILTCFTTRNDNFHSPITDWMTLTIFSCALECSKQLLWQKLIAKVLGHCVNVKISPKVASEKAQWFSENRFFSLCMVLLQVSAGNNVWVSFLVHHLSLTATTVIQYCPLHECHSDKRKVDLTHKNTTSMHFGSYLVPGCGLPSVCHDLGLHHIISYTLKALAHEISHKWNSFCICMFVPRKGGIVAIFMCYLKIFMWSRDVQQTSVVYRINTSQLYN